MQHPLPGYPVPKGGEFGASRAFVGYGPHDGLDFTAPSGTRVRAADAGVVIKSKFELTSGAGNVIAIDHGAGLRTDYAHLSGRYVNVGDRVAAGAVIGAVGSSGTATGPHLHFAVIRAGVHVDPAPFVGLPSSSKSIGSPGVGGSQRMMCTSRTPGPDGRAVISDPLPDGTCPADTFGPFPYQADDGGPAAWLADAVLDQALPVALNVGVVVVAGLVVWQGIRRMIS